jgi:hypothetical protein
MQDLNASLDECCIIILFSKFILKKEKTISELVIIRKKLKKYL